MHLFTLVQTLGLGVLWAVKSSAIALFFPFFVVAMIPLRMSLKFLFTPKELEAVSITKNCIFHTVILISLFISVGWKRCWQSGERWRTRLLRTRWHWRLKLKKTAIIFCIYILCTCHDANSIQILNFQDKLQ